MMISLPRSWLYIMVLICLLAFALSAGPLAPTIMAQDAAPTEQVDTTSAEDDGGGNIPTLPIIIGLGAVLVITALLTLRERANLEDDHPSRDDSS